VTASAIVADAPKPAPPLTVAGPRDAQPAEAHNALVAEVLGNGLLYSVDYERLLFGGNAGVRGGASFLTYGVSHARGSGNLVLATFPIVASYYWGSSPHKLQLGVGATVLYVSASSDSTGAKFESVGDGLDVAATAVVGYRYLPKAGGWTFSVGFTPLFRGAKGLLPWGGVSGGYSF
jgi:hypothetical protein